MATVTSKHYTGSNVYWNMLKNLDNREKLDLINKLSASLLLTINSSTTNDKGWATKFAGRWIDDRTTEEIIEDIHSARTSNREIEL